MKQYTSISLADAVFNRDVRQKAPAMTSVMFHGTLSVSFDCDQGTDSYTFMRKPGKAVVNIGLGLPCLAHKMPLNRVVPEKEVKNAAKKLKTTILGLIYHEMAHLIGTDMTGERFSAVPNKYSPFMNFIQDTSNTVEDPSVERQVVKIPHFKYMKPYFKSLVKLVFLDEAKNYKDDGTIPSFMNYMLLYLRIGPSVLTAKNQMFEQLKAKGLIKRLRKAYRERDPKQRCQNQIDLAIWIIDELGIKPEQVKQQMTPDRPVIILVDPTSKNGAKTKKLQPQTDSLPPVSIVEAEEDEEGGEDGETPDADIIDMRKKKPKSEKKSEQSESGTQGGKSEDESPNDETDESDGEDGGAGSSQTGADGDSKDDRHSGYSETQGGLDPEDEDELGDEDSEENAGDAGEEGEEGEGSVSNDAQPEGGGRAGDQSGSLDGSRIDESGFDWDIGDDDPLEVLAEKAIYNSVDADLDNALRVDLESKNNSQCYRCEEQFEIDKPEIAKDEFRRCVEAVSIKTSNLAAALEELKTESDPVTLHYQEEGEMIDLGDYIEHRIMREVSLNVYSDEVPGREITDLAVGMLVDCSGSMQDYGTRGKSSLAYTTVCMVTVACESAKIPTEVSAFSTGGILVAKQFEETIEESAAKLGILKDGLNGVYKSLSYQGVGLWGGTDLEGALPLALGRLRAYEEKACKLLFVITDGETGSAETTGAIVQKAREDGIVVIGIGLGTSERKLSQCFGHCKVFDQSSLGNLPVYVAEEVQAALASTDFKNF